MQRQRGYSNLSELEREFELEMEDAPPEGFEFELGDDSETDEDRDNEGLEEAEFEQDDEAETMLEGGYGGEPRSNEYVERFLELSAREFESPAEVDQAMNEVLDDMEREYFFGALKRGLKKLGKSQLLRSLAKKGLQFGVSKFLPGLQGALQLARGNVKGALLNFGKQALGTVVPGGMATLDAVRSLGLGAGEQPASDRETWENYVTLAREAYEHLADNITATADQPAEASRLTNNAIQYAIKQAQSRTAGAPTNRGRGTGRPGRVLRLRVAPGQRIKLIISGA